MLRSWYGSLEATFHQSRYRFSPSPFSRSHSLYLSHTQRHTLFLCCAIALHYPGTVISLTSALPQGLYSNESKIRSFLDSLCGSVCSRLTFDQLYICIPLFKTQNGVNSNLVFRMFNPLLNDKPQMPSKMFSKKNNDATHSGDIWLKSCNVKLRLRLSKPIRP